ncbi:copper resistance CopC family protein [Paenibacillus sp. MMO-58]|uniref:copper resistance CopC family protein n=1 Tax=Paenibacillus sp. MMO-58 TaxID=3081290 RepID=UPI0030198521
MSRSKVLVFLALIMLFVFPQLSYAHTKMESSIPESNATVQESLSEITMQFNTDVASLSTLKLLNGKGEEIKGIEIQINDKQMKGVLNEPLPNDTYTVKWKIVGGDGHPIEGDYSFLVDVTVQSTPQPTTETIPEATVTPSPSPTIEPLESTNPSNDSASATKEDNSTQGIFWIVIGVVLIALIVLLAKFKKKS